MDKLRLIAAVLIMVGMASVLGWQYSSNSKLQRENDALKLVVAEMKQTQEPREPVSKDDGASKEQHEELLRLRGEVTQLRQQTNQIAALHQQNEALKASIKAMPVPSQGEPLERKKKLPEDALPQDIHPKETWGYRGYTTPDATIESMCWAMFKGDKAAFMAGLSPEMLSKIPSGAENDFDKVTSRDMGEFRILDRQPISEDMVVVTVYSTRKDANGVYVGNSENTAFKKIDGQWKVTEDAAK
jgi:cell division protein FtsB